MLFLVSFVTAAKQSSEKSADFAGILPVHFMGGSRRALRRVRGVTFVKAIAIKTD